MTVQVGKWGNSLGLRIPGSLAKDLGLKEGSVVDLEEVEGAVVLRPVTKPRIKYVLSELVDQIAPNNLHAATDWGAPLGQEDW